MWALARMVRAGLHRFGHPRTEILETMQETISLEAPHLQKYIPLLGSIAHTALLLGLLGTVTGLIRYFQIIQLKATTLNPVAPGDLAGGIWEALLNTTFGLIVAIPTYAMYNYLAYRTNSQINQLDATATHFARFLDEEYAEVTNANPYSKPAAPIQTHGV